ncbi:PrgI family protein [Aerococcaceae bacterium NML191292]|nr:PrgI family protein [Aerococcaceae bacterium NML191292]MCW6667551.1 PrgI family protein [Aerococcaceae bacterium NML190938]MCW6675458.1 PrgI family protein [Aerococcaceae bacterium NML171108]
MAFVPVPGDLEVIKSKVVGGLTARQALCFTIALFLGSGVFYLLGFLGLNTDIKIILVCITVAPLAFVALYKKDGLVAEQFLKQYIQVKFKRPSVRVYKNNNIYRIIDDFREGEEYAIRRTKTREAASRGKTK